MSLSSFSTLSNSASVSANSTVGVTATKGLTYSIHIGPDRVMRKGGESLLYRLFSDAGLINEWGTDYQSGLIRTAPSNATSAHSIFGSIPAQQEVSEGYYSDSVLVTVEW